MRTKSQDVLKILKSLNYFFLTNPRWGWLITPFGVKRPRRVPVEKRKTSRQFWPKWRLKWPKLYAHVVPHTYTRVRALNVSLPHPFGVWYTSREAEGWPCDRKRKAAAYQPRRGWYRNLWVRYVHRGLPYAHHPQRGWLKKKKKKNTGWYFWPKHMGSCNKVCGCFWKQNPDPPKIGEIRCEGDRVETIK